MEEISLCEFNSIFSKIQDDWFLITAKHGEKINSMTAGWGGIGCLFSKPVVYIFIRPQRYTYEFVKSAGMFSLTFFDKKYKEMLYYFGKVSGRYEDKIKKSKLSVKYYDDIPYVEEAEYALLCSTLLTVPLDKKMINKKEIMQFYQNNDYHTMFVGEIVKILKNN